MCRTLTVSESPFNKLLDIQCLSSSTAFSAGDALRELDDMQVSLSNN
jgi:translation initiation factor eIF-2B subunit epsilon